MNWDRTTKEKFEQMLGRVPVFLKGIAQEKVGKRAQALAAAAGRAEVTEKDLVDAFFAETPFGFHGPMKTDMEALGIDYTQYGHPR